MNGLEDEQRAPEEPAPAAPVEGSPGPEGDAVQQAQQEAPEVPEPAAEQVADRAPEEPAPAVPSGRWLVLQASALLRTVATQNYICYGTSGVPRYGVGESAPARSPAMLDARLAVAEAGAAARLRFEVQLRSLRFTARETVWSGFDAARQVQVLWVWDFYRILSHIVLRVALPAGDGALPDLWQETLDAVRASQPGDGIEVDVESACGDFEQAHTLRRAAVEWEKGKP